MLARTDDAVSYLFATSELEAREAITMWWIVFNNPDGCSDPCSPDDIFIDGDASLGLDLDAIAASDAVGGCSNGRVTYAPGWVFMHDRLREGEVGDEIILGEGTPGRRVPGAEGGPVVLGIAQVRLVQLADACDFETFRQAAPREAGLGLTAFR